MTLATAAVGTAWSLLRSPRNGQAALHLFQKHWLSNSFIGLDLTIFSPPRQQLASYLVTTTTVKKLTATGLWKYNSADKNLTTIGDCV
jgi:hypothetical protein